MSFATVRLLRRSRRFSLGEPASAGISAYEDFESQTLNFGDWHLGWAGTGIVYTYNALVAYENFETSTLTNNSLPNFGWLATGKVTAPSITSQPSSVTSPPGATVTFSVVTINGLATVTYQWQKNGVNLSNGGVVSGATTTTLTLTGITGSELASYQVIVTDAAGSSVTSNSVTLADTVTDWAARVVTNGGAAPSGGTKTALSTFAAGLVTDGVWAKLLVVNAFVPDNLIASLTPLQRGTGADPWVNHNFISGDLTIDGLRGNASTKYLDTGMKVSTSGISVTSASIIAYAFSVSGGTCADLGCVNGTTNDSFDMYCNFSGTSYFDAFTDLGAPGRINTATHGAGYYCGSRTASNAINLYYAKSSSAHASIVSGSGTAGALPAFNLFVFDLSLNGAEYASGHSDNRLSFAAVAIGLTSTDSSNLYTRIQALRTSLGGGFV
jgi:hypothetical protein